MTSDPIDDMLSEISSLENEMRGLHFKRNVVDAYYISLWCLLLAAWVRSGGLKRLRAPANSTQPTQPANPAPSTHHTQFHSFHAMDILLVAYLSTVLA